MGISNALVDVGVLNLFLLIGPSRSPELLVLYDIVALGLANVNSYLWNTLWTFRDQARHDARQVGLFTAQGLLDVGVSNLLLWLTAYGLRAHTGFSPLISGNAAKAVSMPPVFRVRTEEGRARLWQLERTPADEPARPSTLAM